jgi:Mrp family chromosome partitioning ATPase
MANPKNYKALLIRKDARDAIDEAKKAYEKVLGMEMNYTQFILKMCDKFVKELNTKGE